MIELIQNAGILIIWPISLILLVLILLQGGAGDISSSFGGGGQLDSSLGVGAASKISTVTGWLVAVFLILVVTLSIKNDGAITISSVVSEATPAVVTPIPMSVETAAPAAAPTVVVEPVAAESTAAPAPVVTEVPATDTTPAAPEIEIVK